MLRIAVGIPAFNEEDTIGEAVSRILNQRLSDAQIEEIWIISESTDRTDEIVQKFAGSDFRVRLARNHGRLGLSAALNLFLDQATSPILVVTDADTFLEPDAVEILVRPFVLSEEIGGTSGRKAPITRSAIVRAFWDVHHEFCSVSAKMCSSIIAFRRYLIDRIPPTCGTPDTFAAYCIQKKGMKVAYVPEAVGRVAEPNSFWGHIRQRKRIYVQHLALERELSFTPPALRPSLYVRALGRAMRKRPELLPAYAGCAFDEVVARLSGSIEFRFNHEGHHVWEKVR